jgi:hypothetical protein
MEVDQWENRDEGQQGRREATNRESTEEHQSGRGEIEDSGDVDEDDIWVGEEKSGRKRNVKQFRRERERRFEMRNGSSEILKRRETF